MASWPSSIYPRLRKESEAALRRNCFRAELHLVSFLFSFTVKWPLQPFSPVCTVGNHFCAWAFWIKHLQSLQTAFQKWNPNIMNVNSYFSKVYVSNPWAIYKSSLKEKEWSQGFRIAQIMTLNTILQISSFFRFKKSTIHHKWRITAEIQNLHSCLWLNWPATPNTSHF